MQNRTVFTELYNTHLTHLPRNPTQCEFLLTYNDCRIPLILKVVTPVKRKSHSDYYYKILRPLGVFKLVVFFDPAMDTAVLVISDDIADIQLDQRHESLSKRSLPFHTIKKCDFLHEAYNLWINYYTSVSIKQNVDDFIADCLKLSDSKGKRALQKAQYGSCQDLEAKTNEYIKKMIGNRGIYWATPAATCSADSGFKVENIGADKNLGLQLKVSNQSSFGNYTFNRCNNYPGMIIICRPLPFEKEPSEFLVMPNDSAIATINKSFQSPKHHLFKFRVPQTDLVNLLINIYKARHSNESTVKWPSGAIVDVSNIKFFTEDELNTPTSEKCKKEYENTKRRERTFPTFTYAYPDTQATYDVEINGIRVQDKCAEESSSGIFSTKIVKNVGNVSNRRQKGPYEVGDFEALFINIPDNTGAFLLPASKLESKGILKNENYNGKQWVSAFKPGWICSRDRDIDMWSQEYYIDYKSPQAQNRFEEILDEIKQQRKDNDSQEA